MDPQPKRRKDARRDKIKMQQEDQHLPKSFIGVNKSQQQPTTTVQKIRLNLSPMIQLIKPLIWPKNHLRLQILIVVSGFTVILGCAVELCVPIYAQKIVDSLTPPINTDVHKSVSGTKTHLDFRWDLVLIFIALKICQGVGALGLVNNLQQLTWIPIGHHARHQIQVKFFEHIHKMSLSWLMPTKTGDILGALERGTESVTSTLEHLIYSVGPTIVNIIVAMSYLSWKFGWMYGIIVGSQIVLYLILTAYITEKRSKHQGSINASENNLRQNVVESLFNFETVKCFGNEGFESLKYSKNLKSLHYRQYLIRVVSTVLEASQLLVIYSGLLACSLLLISSIVSKDSHLTVGDYVLCTSYLTQLYGPLNYLGGYYRELRVKLIDAQAMLEFLREEPQIQNSPNAYDLEATEGGVEFQNVTFTSDSGESVLKNVTFSVHPKTTVALVGHSGSGKTSIVRLLLRVIEATAGEVLIDGNSVKDVTLESLRSLISIVPQDTALFNDTIRNNIKYGKLTATDYEVALAASSAQIHTKIMSFPDGYDTIVGERGTRLSGGERQRIAISRAILKNPKILILDEATSSLDSKTEREIQQSIKELCKNRTCIMITHRLNPVVDADCILVLKEGQIVEQGTHSVLLEQNGTYAAMWKQQNKEGDKLSSFIPTSPKQNRHL